MQQELVILSGAINVTSVDWASQRCGERINYGVFDYLDPNSSTTETLVLGRALIENDKAPRHRISGNCTTIIRKKIKKETLFRKIPERKYDTGWQPKIKLMTELFSTHVIGASIVPYNPSIPQTWYLKVSRLDDEPGSTLRSYSLFSKNVQDFSYNIRTTNDNPRLPNKPPLLGFVSPFPKYYNDTHVPDLRPEMNPQKINVFDASSQEAVLEKIEHDLAKEKCRAIWECFLEDPQTKELAFSLIDVSARNIKRIHLTKANL